MPANLRTKHAFGTDAGTSEPPLDAADLINAARELAPKIEAARADIEHERQIPRALVDAMAEARLFALWLPKAFGGPELNLVDYIRVIEELARADGSAAWCATVAACYSRIAGYLRRIGRLVRHRRRLLQPHRRVSPT
jgi:alkylation response protein AidB-like acyl-CoA dehydrogenase